ncbi:hypothetical protein RZO55_25185 [Clostridium boliviensis]|uniref:Uncharacterized protein n=1 Tax=Clostridium boliviensis TaxID=318465 RepID=A0ABU4GTG2_9CLOT|nr:hypothetical protein [Clostridium boliviensis]MDW2800869.1 hypothetical protein [Clostridium boliviensis]
MGYFTSVYTSELSQRARGYLYVLRDRADKDGNAALIPNAREMNLSHGILFFGSLSEEEISQMLSLTEKLSAHLNAVDSTGAEQRFTGHGHHHGFGAYWQSIRAFFLWNKVRDLNGLGY